MKTAFRWVVGIVVVLHGLIHLMGAAKGLGWATVTALAQPISPGTGAVWLGAAFLVVGAGLLLALDRRRWWVVGAAAAVLSQAVIITSWSDAKAGTVVNAVLLVAAVYGWASQGPASFRAEFRRRVEDVLNDPRDGRLVCETDLTGLPVPVAAWVRRSGAVGQPRVSSLRARMHGRIRSGPGTPWMSFTAEQVNTFGAAPARLFLMHATMFGLPVEVLHTFVGPSATMRVRLCSLLPMVDAAGPEMDRGETVTLFNDLCVLAPGALVDAPISWLIRDERRVSGTFVRGAYAVTAELAFDQDGDLVDFVSDDRLRASSDGKAFTPERWSTPLRGFGSTGTARLALQGEARWHAPAPEGEFTYVELDLDEVTYNDGHPARRVDLSQPQGQDVGRPR